MQTTCIHDLLEFWLANGRVKSFSFYAFFLQRFDLIGNEGDEWREDDRDSISDECWQLKYERFAAACNSKTAFLGGGERRKRTGRRHNHQIVFSLNRRLQLNVCFLFVLKRRLEIKRT